MKYDNHSKLQIIISTGVLIVVGWLSGCHNSIQQTYKGSLRDIQNNENVSNNCVFPQVIADVDTMQGISHFYTSCGIITAKKHPLITMWDNEVEKVRDVTIEELAPIRLSFVNLPFVHLTGGVSLWSKGTHIQTINADNIYLLDLGTKHGVRIIWAFDNYELGGPLEIHLEAFYNGEIITNHIGVEFFHLPLESSCVVISGPVSEENTLSVNIMNSRGEVEKIGILRIGRSEDELVL